MSSLQERAAELTIDKMIGTTMQGIVDSAVRACSARAPDGDEERLKYTYLQGMIMALYTATAHPDAATLLKRYVNLTAPEDTVTVMQSIADQLAMNFAAIEKIRTETLAAMRDASA